MNKQSKLFTEELARRNPDWEKIVAVHNAALAAERKGHEMDGQLISNQEVEIHRLRSQLAAERENAPLDCIVHPEGESPYTGMTEGEYREQLAAEVEKVAMNEGIEEELREANKELAKQLAAERETYRRQALSNHTAQDANRSTIKYLQEQLAAERKKHESCVAWEDHNETLDELTVERETVKNLRVEAQQYKRQIETLAHAFESERELRKRYEDELKTVAQWDEYAKDALAKLNL